MNVVHPTYRLIVWRCPIRDDLVVLQSVWVAGGARSSEEKMEIEK